MPYRFGEYTLDQDTRQLLLNRNEVHLSPKAFDLLALLVANRARAVPKGELQERMWPSTFVEESNLASLVAEIRRALHDNAEHPSFVRTIYGFGYRFIGDVTVDAAETPAAPAGAKLWLTFDRRQIPLLEGVNVIGRAPDAAIQIDSPGISRYHARVLVAHGEATLEDLGSKNGTSLNGTRLTAPQRLHDGNEIRVGAVALTFRISSQTSPTETIPSNDA